ncbi:hypothetical protein HPB51_010466 [Rhipicephalus microplus]|uniref:DUF7041 domain-containing protein n=1 Tax=Rhipicephalus microplus TaxID=6941 RepID=A0A9J6E0J2_RHIMP|nr:hypothetical protein HPB51_010466 [Rhipicephalus microplus]
MEATGMTNHDVSAISFRLPAYSNRNPSIWLIQAESQFVPSGVRMEQRKHNLVVSALSATAAEEVSDLLSGFPATTSYSTRKAALLERTTASQRSRIQQLLSGDELGDHRTSQLLCRMCKLISGYTTTTDENLLRELLLQRLPANAQMALATACTLDLHGLASLADTVLEVGTPSVCNVTPSFNNVSAAPHTSSDPTSRPAAVV